MIKPDKFTTARSAVAEKVKESAVSVLPIVLIVTLLCLGIAPTKPELLLCFFIGALMIVLGMGLFSLGAEQSMTPIGNKIGTALTKTKNLPLILGVSFLLGFAITIAEPDLQVLAETAHQKHRSACDRRCRRRLFHVCLYAAHHHRCAPALAADRFLYIGFCACGVCRPQLSEHRI